MRVNVIRNSSPGLFNAMILPEMRESTRSWLEQQSTKSFEGLSEAGRKFAEMGNAAYQRLTDVSIGRQARSVVRSLAGMLGGDRIQPIESYTGLQMARPVMQQYIMAETSYRKLYHEQRCNGYSDSYVDLEPGRVGEAHSVYRRVMDTVLVDTPTGWEVTMYPDELQEWERALQTDEQKVILDAWSLVQRAIGEGVDPGDIFNSPL